MPNVPLPARQAPPCLQDVAGTKKIPNTACIADPLENRLVRFALSADAPPLIMAILNATPDSFSDGDLFPTTDALLRHAERQVEAGAHILDLGAESTRPGAENVPADIQIQRLEPLLVALAQEAWPVILSVDTSDAAVARFAIAHGVCVINDTRGLRDPKLAACIRDANCHAIVMHSRAEPKDMLHAEHTQYRHLLDDVAQEIKKSLEDAVSMGISKSRLLVDPGLGFAKTYAQNWQLLAQLRNIKLAPYPLVLGPSRKRFLAGKDNRPAHARDQATAAVCCWAVAQGTQIVRVHHVEAVVDAVEVGFSLRQSLFLS